MDTRNLSSGLSKTCIYHVGSINIPKFVGSVNIFCTQYNENNWPKEIIRVLLYVL